MPKPIGKVMIPEKVYFFSGPLCIVSSSIRITMEGLYAAFSDAFLTPFKVVLMLYVCVYAISFMFGLVNPRDFALRLFKLAVVWVIVSDNCFFYNHIYGGFISTSNDLIKIIANVNGTAPANASAADAQTSLYESLDKMFTNIVGVNGLVGLGVVLLQNLSSQGKGIVPGMLEILGIGSMALAMLRAMVTLGVAMAAMAFFLLFTPMFLSFFLFQTTKRLFDSWLSMLISFTLQPFIIFAFLGMMSLVQANAAPKGMDINALMEKTMSVINVKLFEPMMMEGRATVNVYELDRSMFADLKPPIVLNADDSASVVQQKYLEWLTPKLFFWIVINMVMAGFIKEVPGFAQRLSGYISLSTPLGATGDSAFGKSMTGIVLPGISRGAGGEITSGLRDALYKNQAVRGMGMGAVALGTAAGLSEALQGKGRVRDGALIENQAAVGEANREGPQTSRAGTLGELLGNKTTNRDGTQAGGIESPLTAMRDGANVVNMAGVEGGAARIETTANQNIKRGAEALSGIIPGINFTAPAAPEKPTVRRDINLRDVELLRRNEGTTTYMVNGKPVDVTRAEEERFLAQRIAEINKDMTKTKTMGARGAAEMRFSLEQRQQLEARLSVLEAEKRALEAAEEEAERLKIRGASDALVAQVAKDIPLLVQQQNVAGVGQAIAKLQASSLSAEHKQLISELQVLEKAMGANTMQRMETTNVPLAPQSGQKPAAAEMAKARQNLLLLQKKALKAIEEIKKNAANESITKEMLEVESKLYGLVEKQDGAGISNLIAELKASPNAMEYESVVNELRVINQGIQTLGVLPPTRPDIATPTSSGMTGNIFEVVDGVLQRSGKVQTSEEKYAQRVAEQTATPEIDAANIPGIVGTVNKPQV